MSAHNPIVARSPPTPAAWILAPGAVQARSSTLCSGTAQATLTTATAGMDFQPASATLTIPAGATGANVPVDILGDAHVEKLETFQVTLSNLINATMGDDTGIGTIDDHSTTVILSDGFESGDTSAWSSVLGGPKEPLGAQLSGVLAFR